ncbi:MAG: hypothetical protein LBK68_01260 [Candidatus Margulisbacteria bacterium]|jgi:hypothetical protein|nr:hypothetical protein [Candidatus Margulisiibacteriota bacterium]
MPDKIIMPLLHKDRIEVDILRNKMFCAKQAASPEALPEGVSKVKALSFFKEAIFALGDAEFLYEKFWQDIAARHNISKELQERLYIEFATAEIRLRGGEA